MINVIAIIIPACKKIVALSDKPECKDTPTAKASIDAISNSRIH